MKKYKVLVLTDHTRHTKENSLYALLSAMRKHPHCERLDVATRANPKDKLFFEYKGSKNLYVTTVQPDFAFHPEGYYLSRNLHRERVWEYDIIWLRLPPPLPVGFLDYLTHTFPDQLIINDPKGIYETGSKAFLMNFPELCPPMDLCYTVEDILDLKTRFPIVLKPLREYGGRGIVKIEGDKAWIGSQSLPFIEFIKNLAGQSFEYLGVQYLKNVSQGDKRIIVINGEIMGASLRLPAKDSWLCNVAQGGTDQQAEVDDRERYIVEQINPHLAKMGIVMYGIDTLVDNDGQRVLSEINTTSIGGLPQMEQQTGKPLVQQGVDLIWQFIMSNEEMKNNENSNNSVHTYG